MTTKSIFGSAVVTIKTLSDDSKVYDVEITDGQSIVEISALNEALAIDCCDRINFAIKLATGQTLNS